MRLDRVVRLRALARLALGRLAVLRRVAILRSPPLEGVGLTLSGFKQFHAHLRRLQILLNLLQAALERPQALSRLLQSRRHLAKFHAEEIGRAHV